MGTDKKLNLRAIFLEAFFVVLGVVLAFSVNQCRQNRAEEDRATHALELIQQEIRNNRAMVTDNYEYHSYLMDTLRSYLGPGSTNLSIRVFTKGFVSQDQPLRNAWETAQATDALKDIDYNRHLQLSELYHLQEKYDFQYREIGSNIYEMLLKDGHEAILQRPANLFNIIGTLRYREAQLLEAYDALIGDKEAMGD